MSKQSRKTASAKRTREGLSSSEIVKLPCLQGGTKMRMKAFYPPNLRGPGNVDINSKNWE